MCSFIFYDYWRNILYKDEPQMAFYKKRASKILSPLFFWSLIYYLYVHDRMFNLIVFIQNYYQIETIPYYF